MNWIYLPQDRDEWWDLINMAILLVFLKLREIS
jgi:hypothetical protein